MKYVAKTHPRSPPVATLGYAIPSETERNRTKLFTNTLFTTGVHHLLCSPSVVPSALFTTVTTLFTTGKLMFTTDKLMFTIGNVHHRQCKLMNLFRPLQLVRDFGLSVAGAKITE